MPGVHIVTDSACDLTDQLVKEHSVIVVPLSIRFGDEELEDRRQLTPAEFWERCRGKGDLPSTAAPSPGAFQAAFQQAADEGAAAVLCLSWAAAASFQVRCWKDTETLFRRAGDQSRATAAERVFSGRITLNSSSSPSTSKP